MRAALGAVALLAMGCTDLGGAPPDAGPDAGTASAEITLAA